MQTAADRRSANLWLNINHVGKFANLIGYSDVSPFEIVRVVSEKCIEVRSMNAELDPTWKPEFVTGGFAGHCHNNNQQRWVITSDSEGHTFRIRLRNDGHWYSAFGSRFQLSDEPRKHYDYNF